MTVRSRVIGALAVVLVLGVVVTMRLAGPSSESATLPMPTVTAPDDVTLHLPEHVTGDNAVEVLGDQITAAAEVNDRTPEELLAALEDPTYALDGNGRLYVAERAEAHGTHEVAPETGRAPQAALVPLDQTFQLNSKPGSNRTIYLDFDGHTVSNSVWNAQQGIPPGRTVPAFNREGGAGFSPAELEFIQLTWQSVAEDFAPFDVNVTTQAPPQAAITRYEFGDDTYGARAIITTPGSQLDFPSACPITSGCAGVAYLETFAEWGFVGGVWTHQYLEGAFVNAAKAPSPHALAVIVSHEIGHNLGLNHAGDQSSEYYGGVDNWGPIMGSPYGRALTQWTDHSYDGAVPHAGGLADDVGVMTSLGLQLRVDDAGPTVAAAGSGAWSTFPGLITSSTDVDTWSLGQCTGDVTVTVTPTTPGGNLDAALTVLRDGAVAGSDDPESDQTGFGANLVATGVSASVTTVGTSGTFHAQVRSSQAGPEGGYGNVGPYTVTADCSNPTAPAAPTRLALDGTGPPALGSLRLTWAPSVGATSYVVTAVPASGGATVTRTSAGASTVVTGLAHETRYDVTVRAVNSVGESGPSPSIRLSTLRAPAAASFTDVADTHVFRFHIAWLASTGITTGYADGSFQPGQPVLREQMAAFLYRYDHDGANPAASDPLATFADVASAHVFSRHIEWLADQGITTGYEGNTFRPAQPVLREQMAAFLYRLAGSPLVTLPSSSPFLDVASTHTFYTEIVWLASTGVTAGYEDGTFRPSQPVLREQMAAFLYRFDNLP